MSTFPQITIQNSVGNIITVTNQIDVRAETFTSDNVIPGATLLPADNATDFLSGNNLILISSMGMENSEIVTTTSHTNFSFTTAALLLFHSRGESIQQIAYDQIVVLKSPSLNGSYSPFSTVTMQVTQSTTVLFDSTGLTTDYYKVQWRNSITGEVSELSDPISVSAYSEYSVYESVIAPVINAMGISKDDPKITIPFCLQSVDDARKYVENKLFGIRQDWRQEFEYPIRMLAGSNNVRLPENIDFHYTDRSLLSARFLLNNIISPYNMRYIDKRSWNQISYSVRGGITTTDTAFGATTIDLNSAGDFPINGGAAYVQTTDYDQIIMAIQYTAVDPLTNKLLGVTGVNRPFGIGTQIWCQPNISQPIMYTVFEDRIWFDRVIPDSMQGTNLYIDFYKKLDKVSSLYQILPEHYREIYKWYLRYAIKYRKDLNTPTDDPDLVKFEGLVTAMFNNLYTGQDSVVITG